MAACFVTDAAIAAYRRLQARVPERLLAHERPDGGLICERQRGRGRPAFYRITPTGAVEPTTSLTGRRCVSLALPCPPAWPDADARSRSSRRPGARLPHAPAGPTQAESF